MDHRQLLADAAARPVHTAEAVLDSISDVALHTRPMGTGNSIAWLVWHAARQMDVQLAALTDGDQVWSSGGWAERLGVDRGEDEFGFGDAPEEVDALRVHDSRGLRDYLAAVVDATVEYVGTLSAEQLDDVVDRSWDPPTTRGVRLISIIDDAVAHLGQAAYARGIVDGWKSGY